MFAQMAQTRRKRQRTGGHAQQQLKLTCHVTQLNVVYITGPFLDGERALRLQLAADWVIVKYNNAFQGTRAQLGQVFDLVFSVVDYGALVPVQASNMARRTEQRNRGTRHTEQRNTSHVTRHTSHVTRHTSPEQSVFDDASRVDAVQDFGSNLMRVKGCDV